MKITCFQLVYKSYDAQLCGYISPQLIGKAEQTLRYKENIKCAEEEILVIVEILHFFTPTISSIGSNGLYSLGT